MLISSMNKIISFPSGGTKVFLPADLTSQAASIESYKFYGVVADEKFILLKVF